MINEFLTLLDNRNTEFPGILRSNHKVQTYLGLRGQVWGAIFGSVNPSEHFRIAAELTLLLRHSSLSGWETAGDARITYSDEDLSAALLGGGDSVIGTEHNVAFILTPGTPSSQQWSVTYAGGGLFTSVDQGGQSAVNDGFTFAEPAVFDLPGGGRFQVVGEPEDGAQWTIIRDADYVSYLPQINERLSKIDVLPLLPPSIQQLYRNTRVLLWPYRAVSAAVGVIDGL